MITLFTLMLIKNLISNTVWRSVIAVVLILFYCILLVFTLRKAYYNKKLLLAIISIIIVFEVAIASQFVITKKDVPIECVGSVNCQSWRKYSSPVWYTVVSPDISNDMIEKRLACDLGQLILDTEHYNYLFVVGYQDVKLSFSAWDLAFDNLIPPQNCYFIGSLKAESMFQDKTLYIFRFSKTPIIPNEIQWK